MACTLNISFEINYFKRTRMYCLHTQQDAVYGRLFYVVSYAFSVETCSSVVLKEVTSLCSNPCQLKDEDTTLLSVLMQYTSELGRKWERCKGNKRQEERVKDENYSPVNVSRPLTWNLLTSSAIFTNH
jgi:hypothetical protein